MASHTSGWITQKLTNLMRVKRERLAWALTYPLRVVQVVDRVSNSVIGYPWFGVGIVGIKDAKWVESSSGRPLNA